MARPHPAPGMQLDRANLVTSAHGSSADAAQGVPAHAVQTVTGPVGATALGITQMHEHLISDFRVFLPPVGASPEVDRSRDAPVELANLYELKTSLMNETVLNVSDIDIAVAEVSAFASCGGTTLVDATSIGIGRNPVALAAISARTGVNVVMGSGWYVADSFPDGFADRSMQSLADEIERDLTIGAGDTGIRAGFIGEVGLSWPHHALEERSLHAACSAQRRTGVALQIHPGRHRASPLEAMRLVEHFGGDPTRTIMCHVERTLSSLEEMLELARTGCFLEFDLFGQESSYYFVPSFTDMPNDAGRVRYISGLIEAGFGSRLLVSQDICTCVHLSRHGGEGLHHLLHRAVPLMQRMGLSASDIDAVLIDNPALALTGAVPDSPVDQFVRDAQQRNAT
jgi:phosphotriesterase-related protein